MSRLVVVFAPAVEDAGAVQRGIEEAGGQAVVVVTPGALGPASAGAAAVVVDLDAAGVLEVLSQLETPTVGFLAVAETEAVDAALTAGCDQVLPRSAFLRSPSQILGPLLAG